MKHQIVVSIDPLNIQHNVIEYAEELARAGEKDLLLYCVQGMPYLGESEAIMPSVGYTPLPGTVEEVEHIAKALYEKVKQRYPNTRLEQGLGFRATATIGKMDEVQGEGSGSCMLVMPKTSDHGWWDNLLGTIETDVASAVNCPVLFVPEDVTYRGISRIMYLADTASLIDGKHKGFRFLRNFAALHAAQVAVGFIIDQENHDREALKLGEAMDRFKDALPFQFNHEYRFFAQQSSDEILTIAELTHTDIIAFPFRESSMLKRFFNHEITRTLVLQSNIPALVF